MVLLTSGVVLAIGITLLIIHLSCFAGNESFPLYAGTVLVIFSLAIGFLMLGMLVEVKKTKEPIPIVKVTRGGSSTLLEIGNGVAITDETAKVYNAKDSNISAYRIKTYNSYKLNLSNKVIVEVDEQNPEVNSQQEVETL